MRFKDKIVLVTGASRGIGKATALLFASEGATVFVNFVKNKEQAENVVQEIEKIGGKGHLAQGDVKKEEDAEAIVDDIISKYDRIDILVNNAGVTRDMLLISMETEDWDEVIQTNLNGVFHFTRAVAQHMMMEKKGKIINIASFSGLRGGKGQSNYAASKGALIAFTRAVALELAPKNINVNAVAPGMIETDMSSAVRGLTTDGIIKKIPLARYGKPEDCARLIVFLASDDASYITGEVVTIDGGLSGSV
ncbi:MAG: 3-oxoacyl-[acyl-carrier-protein] reductase [Candidatus Ancaeobacter aquaticus]|nr:3-oxoacyl-[acyl-carrier-protein] reductase [Candidatus Ancaeobacter aquaticus]